MFLKIKKKKKKKILIIFNSLNLEKT